MSRARLAGSIARHTSHRPSHRLKACSQPRVSARHGNFVERPCSIDLRRDRLSAIFACSHLALLDASQTSLKNCANSVCSGGNERLPELTARTVAAPTVRSWRQSPLHHCVPKTSLAGFLTHPAPEASPPLPVDESRWACLLTIASNGHSRTDPEL